MGVYPLAELVSTGRHGGLQHVIKTDPFKDPSAWYFTLFCARDVVTVMKACFMTLMITTNGWWRISSWRPPEKTRHLSRSKWHWLGLKHFMRPTPHPAPLVALSQRSSTELRQVPSSSTSECMSSAERRTSTARKAGWFESPPPLSTHLTRASGGLCVLTQTGVKSR